MPIVTRIPMLTTMSFARDRRQAFHLGINQHVAGKLAAKRRGGDLKDRLATDRR
jgi:hypothetical protein